MSEAFRPGFGAELRVAREATKLSVADVAAKLKLTPRQIEAIEAEDHARLPDPVFARGFVRNYARLVGVEPANLITPVDYEHTVTASITAPSAGVSIATRGLRRWLLIPLFGLAAFLLLVALLYHWLRQGEDALLSAPLSSEAARSLALPAPVLTDGLAPQAAPRAAEPGTGGETIATPGAASPLADPPPAARADLPPAATSDISPSVVPDVTPPAPVTRAPVSLPPLPVAQAPAESASRAAPGRHTLRFEAELDAWIQVVDGKGNRYSRLVRAGSIETFAGDPPFKLVVGEAARVKLTYNGHSIDLKPFIGQKVARLTLE